MQELSEIALQDRTSFDKIILSHDAEQNPLIKPLFFAKRALKGEKQTMKHLKKWLGLALCLALLCAMLPKLTLTARAEVYSGCCGAEGDGSNLTWTLDTETGVLKIEGSGEMKDYSEYSDEAFFFCATPWSDFSDSVKEIMIGIGVTSIGSGVFYRCEALTSVTIPDCVTSIGDGAFFECESLTSFTIPDSVPSIGDYTFYNCKALTSLTIPDSVTSIGHSAFSGCEALTSLTIPNSVTSIGHSAFSGCEALTSLTIPNSVTSIDDYAFFGCKALTSFTIPDSVPSIGDYTFYNCKALTSLTIPDSVTSIGYSAFSGCEALTSLTIPDSVTSIGDGAFSECEALTSVAIPDSVSSIGEDAFCKCKALSSVVIGNNVTSIGDAAFYGCEALTSLTIPDSVTSIGDRAFCSCTLLSSVTIGNSVTSIGADAFFYCTALTSVTIGNSVTSIGDGAFSWCESLTSVTIPDSVTSIGVEAFTDCPALMSVKIGNSVTGVGDYAFLNCTALTSVTIRNSETSIGAMAFGYIYDYDTETFEKVPGFCIYGYAGSEAQTYASENGFTFKALDPASGFCDVSTSAYYYQPMLWAVENGITNGTSDVTFGPKKTCTRGQVVTFLWRASGSPEPTVTSHPFKDVKSGAYYFKAMLWAVENGITSGTSETTFGPNKDCTRAQVVTFLWRAAGEPEPESDNCPFTDVKPTAGYRKAVLWAVENGITNGTSETTFSPGKTCTRGQVVTFLYNALGE